MTLMGPCIANVFSSATKICNFTQFIYFCEMLYTFQAVPPPIIRNSKLYIQHRVLSRTFTAICHCRERDGTSSISFTIVAGSSKGLTKYPMLYIEIRAPDDGRRNRLKYVKHFTKINKLCNVVSCWLHLKIN